jgi:hypothetical protein
MLTTEIKTEIKTYSIPSATIFPVPPITPFPQPRIRHPILCDLHRTRLQFLGISYLLPSQELNRYHQFIS